MPTPEAGASALRVEATHRAAMARCASGCASGCTSGCACGYRGVALATSQVAGRRSQVKPLRSFAKVKVMALATQRQRSRGPARFVAFGNHAFRGLFVGRGRSSATRSVHQRPGLCQRVLRTQCCRTPRSSADPLRQSGLAARPPLSILGLTAKPACLHGRLSSNVRRRTSNPFAHLAPKEGSCALDSFFSLDSCCSAHS